MAENQQQERKQFSVPNRDQLIQLIKDLDEEFQHVTLNLIKCDFNATDKDIEKTFPDFKFVKIKNYNPGSFQVVFQMKIDAINFIRNHYDKKILNRRFFIKMGRQHKQNIQDWTGVGYAPRQFKGPHRPHVKKQGYQKTEKKQDQTGQKTEDEKPKETSPQVVTQQAKTQTKTIQEPKKQGKHIPKTETYQKKPYGQRKFNKNYENQGQKKDQTQNNKPRQYKRYDNRNQKKEQAQNKNVQVIHKREQVPHKNVQVVHKKEDAKKQVKKDDKHTKKQEQPKPQPTQEKKEQDDGWIFVANKNFKKR